MYFSDLEIGALEKSSKTNPHYTTASFTATVFKFEVQ